MEAFAVSTLVVAVAEIGDKTQLLALLLAARFRRPAPIILGILLATIANHAGAAAVGAWVAAWLSAEVLRWGLGLSFIAMAAWVLVPDKADDEERKLDRLGPFLATLVSFFLVEIGDKTQIATVALAARFSDLLWVTAGTTAGMMLVNAPAVMLGDVAAKKIRLRWIRLAAAVIFAALGVAALANFSVYIHL